MPFVRGGRSASVGRVGWGMKSMVTFSTSELASLAQRQFEAWVREGNELARQKREEERRPQAQQEE